jgi:uncharacterized protein YdaU (DUF1376 family)
MPEKVDVFMPFFVGDYLRDTADLSLEERGAYDQLLFHMWIRDGRLPLDHHRLARMVGADLPTWERVWPIIQRFFTVTDDCITQKRLAAELDRARARKAAASDAGRAGAAARHGRASSHRTAVPLPPPLATAEPEHQQPDCSPYPNPTPEPSASPDPKPKPHSGEGNAHARVLAIFGALWQAAYRNPYVPTAGDKSQLGRLLRAFPDESAILAFDWHGVFRSYLADHSRWVAEDHRHSLKLFCDGGLNKYRTTPLTAGLSQSEAKTLHAAEVWRRGKEQRRQMPSTEGGHG